MPQSDGCGIPPAASTGSEEEILVRFRRIRAEVNSMCMKLIRSFNGTPPPPHTLSNFPEAIGAGFRA